MSEARAIAPASVSFIVGMKQRLNGPLRAGLVFGNQGLNSVVNLTISLFLIRMLGITEFGVYAVYFAVAFGISAVVNALIGSPLVSIASQKAPDVKAAMIASASIAIAGLGLSLLLLGLGLDLLLWATVGPAHKSLIAVAFGTSMAASEFARRVCFLGGRPDMVWRFDLMRFGLLAVAFTLTAWLADDAKTAQYVLLFCGANALALAALVLPGLGRSAATWRAKRIRSHVAHFVRSGRWLSMSSLLQLASDQALLLVTAFIAGPFAAGAIKTCQTIVGVVNPVLLALEHTLPKKLGEDLRRHGPQSASMAYGRLSLLTLLAIGSVLAALAIFASPILGFVAGDELRGYEHLLRLCCLLWLLYPVTLMLSFMFRAHNKTLAVLASQTVAAVFALAAGIPLIVELGAYGAVLGTIVAQATAAVVLLATWKRVAPRTGEAGLR